MAILSTTASPITLIEMALCWVVDNYKKISVAQLSLACALHWNRSTELSASVFRRVEDKEALLFTFTRSGG